MRISEDERSAIQYLIYAGARYGYGNLIAHLQTAWARTVMAVEHFDEKRAREDAGGPGYPFAMQDDILERGEWDETGKRYRSR